MSAPPPLPFDAAAVRKCYGKQRFATRKDARQATTRHARRYGTEAWPYYCDICRAYHLTTEDPKVRRERVRER